MGLAATETARARIAGSFDTGTIDRRCREGGVEMAMVYERWFTGPTELPASWTPIARWTVPEEVSVGDTIVTIFAARRESVERVRAAVHAFAPELPPRVRVEWLR
jgi:hypothetical protein